MGVAMLCLCLVCLVCLWLRRPAATGGSITLKIAGSQATLRSDFRVYRPQQDLTKRPSMASHLSSLGSIGSMNIEPSERGLELTKDGKTHVVWDIEDSNKLEEWFAQHGTDFDRKPSTKGPSGSLPRIAAASRSHESLDQAFQVGRRGRALGDASPKSRLVQLDNMVDEVDIEVAINQVLDSSKSGLWLPDDSVCSPAVVDVSTNALFADGGYAEYYSTTLNQWVLATVTVIETATGKAERSTRYDVQICSGGQKRHKVDLELLRPPLQPGSAWRCSCRGAVPGCPA
eukprot:SRR837773.9952.p1 GENE.SRR837773.9952~~SRR837773.9952.p1  ORF type:complete len:316 (-),score=104.18 SRR837773.9952:588-1448(-)